MTEPTITRRTPGGAAGAPTGPGLPGAQEAAERFLRTHLLAPSALTVADRLALLRPLDADWVALFGPQADAVREGYAGLWANPALPGPKPGQTELELSVATAGALASGTAAAVQISGRFPGGFVQIAPQLPADSVWVAWRFTAPGATAGMAWDGLCRREAQRWAWFPKLWRVLPASPA